MGIGGKLMTFILKEIKEANGQVVYLTVEPENEVAISLYKKLGFKEKCVSPNYFGQGNARIVMKKLLY